MTHRKHSHAFGTITLTVTACLLFWGFQLPAWAGDATQVEPLALRK
ncbi:cytochrome C, partial [Escherichia coli]|nr:cytochrome C [Escherichia coli]